MLKVEEYRGEVVMFNVEVPLPRLAIASEDLRGLPALAGHSYRSSPLERGTHLRTHFFFTLVTGP